MTDSLVTELGTMGPLRVISRHSAMAYAGSDKSIAEIADELGVRFVGEGSVVRTAKKVRVSCRVIEAAFDRQVLAESYEGDLGNAFDVQRDAAQTIARTISAGFAPTPESRRRRRRVDPEALIAYQRGRFHWWRFTPEHFRRALDYFNEAVERDPELAAAHAGIADVWGAFGYWGLQRPSEVREKIRDAIHRALAIDPENPEAHMMNGAFQFYYERDWSGAETEFRRAPLSISFSSWLPATRRAWPCEPTCAGERAATMRQAPSPRRGRRILIYATRWTRPARSTSRSPRCGRRSTCCAPGRETATSGRCRSRGCWCTRASTRRPWRSSTGPRTRASWFRSTSSGWGRIRETSPDHTRDLSYKCGV